MICHKTRLMAILWSVIPSLSAMVVFKLARSHKTHIPISRISFTTSVPNKVDNIGAIVPTGLK